MFLFKDCDGEEAYQALQKLREEIKNTQMIYDGMSLQVTMTFGLSEIDVSRPMDQSIREADKLLYEGKAGGRDRIVR